MKEMDYGQWLHNFHLFNLIYKNKIEIIMKNCIIESGIFAAPCLIDYHFKDYLKVILNTYEGEPINNLYRTLLKHNAVERFITYVETVLSDIRSGTQKTINISKLLHITSVEQSFRTVILIEFILDSIYYKKYGKFYINK